MGIKELFQAIKRQRFWGLIALGVVLMIIFISNGESQVEGFTGTGNVTEGQLLDMERNLQFIKDDLLKQIEEVDFKILDIRNQRNSMEKPDYLSSFYEPAQKLFAVKAEYIKPTPRIIKHKYRPDDSIVQLFVNMAYQVSSGDMEFIAMLEGENGLRDPYRQSEVINKYGKREGSYGFCQLMRYWHKDIVDDPRFWNNPTWQLEQCYYKWRTGTKFYGYNPALKNRFKFIK